MQEVKVAACFCVTVLKIIVLQNEIWDLQTNAANETTDDNIKGQWHYLANHIAKD